MPTHVTYTKKFLKQLKEVPLGIRKKAEVWIFSVELVGLRQTAQQKSLHDEPLQGQRWGQRSIRLSKSYRLIYRIIRDEVHIELLEVHKHDY